MAERALVTGGAGFVGLHLVRRLLAGGVHVTIVDDLSRGRRDDELAALLPIVRFVEHDLTSPLPDLGGPFDAVYHLAAMVGVRCSTEEPARMLAANVRSVANVVDWCAARPPEVFVLSSTSEVGDGAAALGLAPFPVAEDVPFVLPRPRLARASYALSKAVAEALALHGLAGTRVRVVRYHNVYGPRMGHSHVIPELAGRILAGLDPLPVYGTRQSRAFCHVDDAVRATLAVAGLATAEGLVVNVGNDREEVGIADLARRLCAVAGVAPALAELDPPPGSPDRRLPDLCRLRALTGYEPAVGLDEGLAATFAWYERNARSLAAGPAR